MSQQKFGGQWTQDKLARVRMYLEAYTRIFDSNPKAQFFETWYVDAFAGSGDSGPTDDLEPAATLFEDPDATGFLRGSVRVALDTNPRFDRYLFIEKNAEYIATLEQLRSEYDQLADRIEVKQADANIYLRQWCRDTQWNRSRAVVFLDPYGMQVEWSTIQAIAETRGIDLWLLFPLGQGVNRLLTRNGPPTGSWADRLDLVFGCSEWRERFYSTVSHPSLFGDPQTEVAKTASMDAIGEYFLERLRTVFPGVAPRPKALCNSRGVPIFLLCFAAGNERGAKTALKIANHILRA